MREIGQILTQCISSGCKATCCRTQTSPLLWGDRRKHICGGGHCCIYCTLGFPNSSAGLSGSAPAWDSVHDPKNDISASSDHLNLFVLRVFIKLKKKLFLDQTLRNNTHSRPPDLQTMEYSLVLPYGAFIQAWPSKWVTKPLFRGISICFQLQMNTVKKLNLQFALKKLIYHLITPLLRWGERRQSPSSNSIVLSV